MKKNILALAIASVVAAPIAMADAPTIYGQVSMGLESHSVKVGADTTVTPNITTGTKDKSASGVQVNSGLSMFGIKGSEDLGNGLTAVYKFEFRVNIDDAATLGNRNQYVGLAGGFGTVLMGRHDTPFKMAQGTDLFNYSTFADIGDQAGGLGVLGAGGELRLSNVLAYVSPSFGGVTIVGAFVPKETGYVVDSATTLGDADKESSLTDIVSLAVMYGSKKEGLYLSGAMDSVSKAFIDGNNSASQMRLVAQYATGGLVANVMYQDFGGKALKDSVMEGSTISVGAAYQVGKFTPRLQIMQVDRKADNTENSLNYALGLDYSLGKKTNVYAEYAMLDNTDGAEDTKAEQSSLSVGLVHKF